MSAFPPVDAPVVPAPDRLAPPLHSGGAEDSLTTVLRAIHSGCPDKQAIVESSRSLTYAELWQQADVQQCLLRQAGVQPGDVVAICSPNSFEMITLFLAVLSMEAVPFVINYRMEVLGDLSQINIAWFAVPRRSVATRKLFVGANYVSRQDFDATFELFGNDYATAAAHADTALLATSSGSSGIAKVVRLSGAGTLFNIRANVQALGLRHTDVTAVALPMGYSYGLIGQFLSHLYVGATVLLLDSMFFLNQMVWLFGRHRVTNMFLVPPMVRQLNYLHERKLLPADFSRLRFVAVGGNRIETTAVHKAIQMFGCPIIKTYGLAEAGPRVATHPIHHPDDPNLESVGTPNPGVRVEIIGDDGRAVASGQLGTVRIHSPSVMVGYFNAPPCPTLRPRASITTKDIGYVDTEGRLFVLGRRDDQFVLDGRAYWFREVESVLYAHFAFMKIALRHDAGKIQIGAIAMRDYSVQETDVFARLQEAFGPEADRHFVFTLMRTNSILNEK